MDRRVQGREKQTHDASRNRLSPATFLRESSSAVDIGTAMHVETRYSTVQYNWLAAQLPSVAVAIGQASALYCAHSPHKREEATVLGTAYRVLRIQRLGVWRGTSRPRRLLTIETLLHRVPGLLQ